MQRSVHLSMLAAALAAGCGTAREAPRPEDALGPAGVGPGLRVFRGAASTLEGPGCTEEATAEGDRWCGFVATSSEGTRQLYVFDLSQVMAGVAVSCDAPQPNCLLLSENLKGTSSDYHPTFFGGDTLVYYADDGWAPHAWRPGMDAGRLLVRPPEGVDIGFCTPSPQGAAVACLGFPLEQPDPTLAVADLYAGTVDGASDPPLAPIASVIAATQADRAGTLRFAFGFPTSDYLAWSARVTPDGPETLNLKRVDEPDGPTMVASDVHAWTLSADGTRWFWLRSIDKQGKGMLASASFPDGGAERELLPDTYDYGSESGQPLAALTGDGDIISIADPVAAPDDQLLIDSDVKALLALGDQGHVAYAKHFAGAKVADLFVSSLDGSSRCQLDDTVGVPTNSVQFSPGGGTALWALQDAGAYDAYHSRLADCSTAPVAPDVTVLGWLDDGTAIYMDDFDSAAMSGSLRARRVRSDGGLDPTPAVLVAAHADWAATLGPALLYTVHRGAGEDGLYVRAFGD